MAAATVDVVVVESAEPRLHLVRRLANVVALGLCWCLAMCSIFINISTSTLAVTEWTGNSALSTLPVGLQMLSSAACVVPLGRLSSTWGYRVVFVGAALCAALGSGLMVVAAVTRQTGLLIVGAILQGPTFAVANGFRFIAADFMTGPGIHPSWRPRAISLSVGMAVFAAGIGPESVRHVLDGLPQRYAGAYVLVVGLYVGQAIILALVQYGWLTQLQHQAKQKPAGAPPAFAAVGKDADAPTPAAVKDMVDTQAGSPARSGLDPLTVTVTVVHEPAAAPAAPPGPPPELRSVGRMLASCEFLVPAVSGAVAFCTMASLMSACPVAMSLDGHSYDLSTFVIEAHIVAMYWPAVLVGEVIALLRTLVEVCPAWLTPLLLLLPAPAMWPAGGPAPPAPTSSTASTTRALPKTGYAEVRAAGEAAVAGGDGAAPLAGHRAEKDAADGKPAAPPHGLTSQSEAAGGGPDAAHPHVQLSCQAAPHACPEAERPCRPSRAGWAKGSTPMTTVIVWGAAVLVVADGVLLSGRSFNAYMVGLVLLGLGWAWVYVAASAMITVVFVREPHLKLAVQGGMDTLVIALSAIANATAGVLVRAMGWSAFAGMNMAVNAALTLVNVAYHVYLAYQHTAEQRGRA